MTYIHVYCYSASSILLYMVGKIDDDIKTTGLLLIPNTRSISYDGKNIFLCVCAHVCGSIYTGSCESVMYASTYITLCSENHH